MVVLEDLRNIARSLPEVEEGNHFHKISFTVRKKIFVTYEEGTFKTTVKLSEIDQDVFSSISKNAIYPVENKWGKQGWTIIDMTQVGLELFKDIIQTAYCTIAPKTLSKQVNER